MFQGVPVSAQIEFWRHPDIKTCRFLIGITPFFIAVLVIAVFIMWGLGLIPTVPPNWLFYCALYYVLYIAIVPMNILVSLTRDINLYLYASIINLIELVAISFCSAFFIYQFVTCWEGTQPSSCTNDQAVQIVGGPVTLAIWLLELIDWILFNYIIRGARQLRHSRIVMVNRGEKLGY